MAALAAAAGLPVCLRVKGSPIPVSKLFDQLKKAARERRALLEARARENGAPSLLTRTLAAQKAAAQAPAADEPQAAPAAEAVDDAALESRLEADRRAAVVALERSAEHVQAAREARDRRELAQRAEAAALARAEAERLALEGLRVREEEVRAAMAAAQARIDAEEKAAALERRRAEREGEALALARERSRMEEIVREKALEAAAAALEARGREQERSNAEAAAARRARDRVSAERRKERRAALTRVGEGLRPRARAGFVVLGAVVIASAAWMLARIETTAAPHATSAGSPQLKLEYRLDLGRLGNRAA
jgi:colicin import membrane protein